MHHKDNSPSEEGPLTGENPEILSRAEAKVKQKSEEKPSGFWQLIKEFLPILLVSFLVVFLLKTYLVRPFMIPSGSMEQTLNVHDRILVNRLYPHTYSLQRGDVVVFQQPNGWGLEPDTDLTEPEKAIKYVGSFIGFTTAPGERYLVKRIIGMPGDHIKTEGTTVTVNGKSLNEPYVFPGNNPSDVPFDVTVPDGKLWVMGDHRANSADSRAHISEPSGGFVPISDLQGKAFFRIWPLNALNVISDESQTFNNIPAP